VKSSFSQAKLKRNSEQGSAQRLPKAQPELLDDPITTLEKLHCINASARCELLNVNKQLIQF